METPGTREGVFRILKGCQKDAVVRGDSVIPPGCLQDGLVIRGSQRSGVPRKDWNDAVHPAGMPVRFDPLRTSFHHFWHPFRMRLSFRTIPVVSAMLRPPATLCHPCGMNRNDSKTPGDSFPPKIPHEPFCLGNNSLMRRSGIGAWINRDRLRLCNAVV